MSFCCGEYSAQFEKRLQKGERVSEVGVVRGGGVLCRSLFQLLLLLLLLMMMMLMLMLLLLLLLLLLLCGALLATATGWILWLI